MKSFLTVLLASMAWAAYAGPYSVSWYQIASRGTASTGVTFTVTGAINQPDASVVMTGHNMP